MAKRGAGTELNDRNWDDEEEPEEAGVFTQASEEVMKERVLKKAKRRGGGDESSNAKPMAFGGFAGLTKTSQAKKEINNKPTGTGTIFNESSSYLHGLKSLNESVLAWIKQHVEDSPYIILTPIFKDYEKYLEKLETKRSSPSVSNNSSKEADKGASSAQISSFTAISKPDAKPSEGTNKEVTSNTFTFGTSSSEPSSKGFSFGSTGSSSTNGGFQFSSSTVGTGFSFGSKTDSNSTVKTPGFTFGSSSVNTDSAGTGDKPKPFSFGLSSSTSGGSGFSFGGAASGSTQGASAAPSKDDDEEYVPPKPEVREIKEEGALYSHKCKLYYQKEGAWVDRGVGTIHLKPVEEKKTQILVRADTTLGNILLNVMLNSSMPMSRQGKNNVFVVCVPNPPLGNKPDPETDSKPVPMLIRVKTGEDADELLKKLEERKELL